MTKVSVLYPSGEGINFDMEYYLGTHMPLIKKILGGSMKQTSVDKGIAGGVPGSAATYMVITNLFFDSVESFLQSFTPNAAEIMGDIPKFTNCNPVVQINEVIE